MRSGVRSGEKSRARSRAYSRACGVTAAGRVVGRVSSRVLPPVSLPVAYRAAPPLAPQPRYGRRRGATSPFIHELDTPLALRPPVIHIGRSLDVRPCASGMRAVLDGVAPGKLRAEHRASCSSLSASMARAAPGLRSAGVEAHEAGQEVGLNDQRDLRRCCRPTDGVQLLERDETCGQPDWATESPLASGAPVTA